MPDGTYRAFTWTPTDAFYGMVLRRNGDLLFGLAASNVARYGTYRDDGTQYTLVYASPWLNFGQDAHSAIKMLKSAYGYVYGRGTVSGTLRWAKDYRPLEYSLSWSNTYTASGAEWGDGEWGSGEFGDGLRMRREELALFQQGQVLKFYMTLQSDINDKVALQEFGIRAKIGRQANG